MPTTRYFDEQVPRKRPYLTLRMCRSFIEHPLRRERQEDGRLRFWGELVLSGDPEKRISRVVTLEDGETVHNAFIDRGFKEEA